MGLILIMMAIIRRPQFADELISIFKANATVTPGSAGPSPAAVNLKFPSRVQVVNNNYDTAHHDELRG